MDIIFKAAHLPVSQRVPPARRCPPSPFIRRAGSLYITSHCPSCGGCIVTQAATLPAIAAYPRRLQLARQLAGIRHASPSAPLPSDFGRVGGEARCRSPGKCPQAADGPQTLRSGGRWLPSKCFPLIARRRYVLKRRTAEPLCLMAAGHQRDMAPFGFPPRWRTGIPSRALRGMVGQLAKVRQVTLLASWSARCFAICQAVRFSY